MNLSFAYLDLAHWHTVLGALISRGHQIALSRLVEDSPWLDRTFIERSTQELFKVTHVQSANVEGPFLQAVLRATSGQALVVVVDAGSSESVQVHAQHQLFLREFTAVDVNSLIPVRNSNESNNLV